MLAADPSRGAFLLERLGPRSLSAPGVSIIDASDTLGHLLRTLDRPAPPWLKIRVSDALRTLVTDIDAVRAGGQAHALPRRLLDRGRQLALDLAEDPDLAADPDIDARLVHADLHHDAVLWRPDPGEWVAIAPHPIAADPTRMAAPSL